MLDSLVTEHQFIETYPTIDKEHPLVLFSLNNTLSCDNNNIIKSSIFIIDVIDFIFILIIIIIIFILLIKSSEFEM